MEYRAEIDAAIKEVLDSGQFILGEQVKSFEKELAVHCDVYHAVGVANGTEALYLALKALKVGPGDEVITVSHTSSGTICAIKMTGAIPTFIDIDEKSYLMNPDLIAKAVTPRTKVILPVHLYGRWCDMIKIKDIADSFGLHIIEDCAQYIGNNLIGDMGCYSFYPTKNLGGIGDGGAVICYNSGLANYIRRAREYGFGERFVSNFMGINSRLDEIQAAVLRVRLKYIDKENARRRDLAWFYHCELKDTELILPEHEGVFHQYVVRSKKRDEIVQAIGAQIHYPVPCHKQPAYRDYTSLPVTEKICREIFSLPMRITQDEAKVVCNKIKAII